MRLAAMRYKNYTWPHNPRVYTITYERQIALQKVPQGRYVLQNLGLSRRVMRGEGEFVGEGAYDEFKKLATLFYQESPGLLVHPVWQMAQAWFVGLSLEQEPRADYVRYTFEFWEDYGLYDTGTAEESAPAGESGSTAQGETPVYHTVVKGETLWAIARQYGADLAEVVALNPSIKNPNLIYVGQKVRVK